jgi:hypothetical protein
VPLHLWGDGGGGYKPKIKWVGIGLGGLNRVPGDTRVLQVDFCNSLVSGQSG